MIFGIGIDIAKCERFSKWLKSPGMVERFFNQNEILQATAAGAPLTPAQESARLQHYAARFAAKEAFSKALGCGLLFDLRDVWVENEDSGRPVLKLKGSALEALKKRCQDWQRAKFFVSLSHEKEYAAAQVVIEIP